MPIDLCWEELLDIEWPRDLDTDQLLWGKPRWGHHRVQLPRRLVEGLKGDVLHLTPSTHAAHHAVGPSHRDRTFLSSMSIFCMTLDARAGRHWVLPPRREKQMTCDVGELALMFKLARTRDMTHMTSGPDFITVGGVEGSRASRNRWSMVDS